MPNRGKTDQKGGARLVEERFNYIAKCGVRIDFSMHMPNEVAQIVVKSCE